MILIKNPTSNGIDELCKRSSHNAAKWLRDSDSGDTYYWPADDMRHAEFAKQMGITEYTSGIAVPKEM